MTLRRVGFFLLSAAIVGLTGAATAKRAETTRTVYLSAVDSKGAPITDLTAADLVVKEGGQDRKVASLAEASGPLEIAMLDDDSGGGLFLTSVLQVIQTFQDKAVYAI